MHAHPEGTHTHQGQMFAKSQAEEVYISCLRECSSPCPLELHSLQCIPGCLAHRSKGWLLTLVSSSKLPMLQQAQNAG